MLRPEEDPCHGALRELEEELGVSPSAVECLGALTPLRMFVSRLELQPWLCAAADEIAFRPDPREVERLLFMPLERLCSPAARTLRRRTLYAAAVDVPGWHLDGQFVWGATALVLAEVAALLDQCRLV